MKTTIQVSAKSVQKAIEQGLKELNVTQDEVDIKILDEGGLFRKAKVELILDKPEVEGKSLKQEEVEDCKEAKQEEVKPAKFEKKEEAKKVEENVIPTQDKKEEKTQSKKDLIEVGTEFLKGLLAKMDVEAEITATRTEIGITFNATGEKVSTLIGKRGETLNAIQEVLSNVAKNLGYREEKVFFDVENYKNRREMSLINLAERMAKKALKIEKPIKLERMSAYERKIIHTALQSFEGVSTKSEGEEPNRHLIIIPKKED